MAFARLIAAGEARADAYRQAFGRPELDSVNASKYASKLLKSEEMREKIARLEREQSRKGVMSKEMRMVKLSAQADICATNGDVRGLVACIQELNRMDGAYEPEKVEMSGQMGVSAVLAAIHADGKQRPAVR